LWRWVSDNIFVNIGVTSVSDFIKFGHCIFDVATVLGVMVALLIGTETAKDASVGVLSDNVVFMNVIDRLALEEGSFNSIHDFEG
jgi:arginine exporter protein ArgO